MYSDWLTKASDINLVDEGVYKYPTCNTLVVEKRGQPVLVNSFHLVLMMEALAPKPGISKLTEAAALNSLFDEVKCVAEVSGVKEIWFGCKDERLRKFLISGDGKPRYGIEQVPFPMFRRRL